MKFKSQDIILECQAQPWSTFPKPRLEHKHNPETTQNENKLYMQHDSHFHDSHFHNSHIGIMIGIQILSSFVNGVIFHHM